MITYNSGNIFNLGVEAIVNPVNVVGVMGAGLAKAFRLALPLNYKRYNAYCKEGKLKAGGLFITEKEGKYKYIINAATKAHYRNPSKIEWVEEILKELRVFLLEGNVKSIAIPALGSGLGGLDYSEVRPLIEKHLSGLDNVEIFAMLPH